MLGDDLLLGLWREEMVKVVEVLVSAVLRLYSGELRRGYGGFDEVVFLPSWLGWGKSNRKGEERSCVRKSSWKGRRCWLRWGQWGPV